MRLTQLTKYFLTALLVFLLTGMSMVLATPLPSTSTGSNQSMAEIEECETSVRLLRPSALRQIIKHRGSQFDKSLPGLFNKNSTPQILSYGRQPVLRTLPHRLIQRAPPLLD